MLIYNRNSLKKMICYCVFKNKSPDISMRVLVKFVFGYVQLHFSARLWFDKILLLMFRSTILEIHCIKWIRWLMFNMHLNECIWYARVCKWQTMFLHTLLSNIHIKERVVILICQIMFDMHAIIINKCFHKIFAINNQFCLFSLYWVQSCIFGSSDNFVWNKILFCILWTLANILLTC
jgi:hypothetical protein